MKPSEHDATIKKAQLRLPVSREQKLAIAASLGERKPPLVSRLVQSNMAALATAIEETSNSEGWSALGQESLAARLKLDARTLRRWEDLATDLGLVEVIRGPGIAGSQLYRVDWHCAERLARVGADKSLFRPRDFVQDVPITHDVAGLTDSRSSGTETGNSVRCDPENCPVTPDICPVTPDKCPVPPLTIPHSVLNKNPIRTNPHSDTDDSAVHTGGGRADICPVTPDIFKIGGPRGKPGNFPLTIEALGNADRLDEWFQWAHATGAAGVLLCDRQRIFAVARSVYRRARAAAAAQRDGPGVGAFIALVRRRQWIASIPDDDWARAAIRYLDRE